MNRKQLIAAGIIKPAAKPVGPIKVDPGVIAARQHEANLLTPTAKARRIIEAAVKRGAA
jgi:hypothetical protein